MADPRELIRVLDEIARDNVNETGVIVRPGLLSDAARVLEATLDWQGEARTFLAWLAEHDAPESIDRRTITLTRLAESARDLLSRVGERY